MEEEDILEVTVVKVKVNFHLKGDGTNSYFHCDPNGDPDFYGPSVVQTLLGYMNGYFENPGVNAFLNPGVVPDARIKLELYSEAGNPNDPCGGIFYYANSGSLGHTPEYDNVLNIVYHDNLTNTSSGGFVYGAGLNALYVRNLHYFIQTLTDGSWAWKVARTTMHEVGHIFNLPHAFSCQNSCYDMDNALECGGPSCTTGCSSNLGDCMPCFGCNINCCICTWGTGNNFMGYNPGKAMTPCQWETMFNYMLNEPRDYVCFCSYPEPPLVVSENKTWDKPKLLNRDVVVESGVTLNINCEVRMGEGKKITVEPGGRLIIDDGKITKLCENQWAGIEVQGNSGLTQNATNQLEL